MARVTLTLIGTVLMLVAPSSLGLQPITNTNIQAAANGWTSNPTTAAATYGPIDDWNTAGVSSMSKLFFKQTTFNGDLSKWNVAAVKDMYGLFTSSSFNTDISKWNVAKVSEMGYMLGGASTFDRDISGWNVVSVTYFTGASAASRSIPVSTGAQRAVAALARPILISAQTPHQYALRNKP